MMQVNKLDALNSVLATSFALDDIRLFLDTHPFDEKALLHYETLKTQRDTVLNEYENNFGPIVSYQANAENMWSWVNDPWPWEWEE